MLSPRELGGTKQHTRTHARGCLLFAVHLRISTLISGNEALPACIRWEELYYPFPAEAPGTALQTGTAFSRESGGLAHVREATKICSVAAPNGTNVARGFILASDSPCLLPLLPLFLGYFPPLKQKLTTKQKLLNYFELFGFVWEQRG